MKKKKPPHILVFDSGVGGLSIFRAIQRQYPYCNFSYVCDNAAFPYGEQSVNKLISRVDCVLNHIQSIAVADIIVVACNSASTIALPRIRSRFQQPVIGVVPAIKPASVISQTRVIGLLATPGTVKRQYTKNLINDFAKDCEVISVGSSELVDLAEAKLRNIELCNQTLQRIVEPFKKNNQLDTLVLACTHFPLLLDELKMALPNVNHWIDSAEAIARRVGYWLDQGNLASIEDTINILPEHSSYFTANDTDLNALQPLLSEWRLDNIHIVNL